MVMYECCDKCGYNFLITWTTDKGVVLCTKHYKEYMESRWILWEI